MAAKKPPRGIRNNNPGNIEWGDKWQGLVSPDARTDKRFCQFVDPSWGIRAIGVILINYQDKYNIRTIRGIINRWAPPVENDSNAYINAVAKNVGRDPDEELDLQQHDVLQPLVESIIRHECGAGPLNTLNEWYPKSTVDVALLKAGAVKSTAVVAEMPVTKETVGATATAAIGVAQIAPYMPEIVATVTSQEQHLSSGSWVRVGIGALTIASAILVAYSQVKKHQQGVVP